LGDGGCCLTAARCPLPRQRVRALRHLQVSMLRNLVLLFGAAGLATAQAGLPSVQATRSRPVLWGSNCPAGPHTHGLLSPDTPSVDGVPIVHPRLSGFAELPTDPGRVRDCTCPALVDHSGPSTVCSGLGVVSLNRDVESTPFSECVTLHAEGGSLPSPTTTDSRTCDSLRSAAIDGAEAR
jgi:hypothetical protein